MVEESGRDVKVTTETLVSLRRQHKSVTEIAKECNVSEALVRQKLKRVMTSEEYAATSPRNKQRYTIDDLVAERRKNKTYRKLAEIFGVPRETIKAQLAEAMSKEELVETGKYYVELPDDRLLELRRQYKSVKEIARAFDTTPWLVRKHLRALMSPEEFKATEPTANPIDRNKVMSLRQKHKSYTEIARIMGISSSMVNHILREEMTPDEIKATTPSSADRKHQLIVDLRRKHKSISEIADTCGVSKSTVIKVLHESMSADEIKLYDQRVQTPRHQHKRTVNPAEVLSLRRKKLSGSEIARRLNIPTAKVYSIDFRGN